MTQGIIGTSGQKTELDQLWALATRAGLKKPHNYSGVKVISTVSCAIMQGKRFGSFSAILPWVLETLATNHRVYQRQVVTEAVKHVNLRTKIAENIAHILGNRARRSQTASFPQLVRDIVGTKHRKLLKAAKPYVLDALEQTLQPGDWGSLACSFLDAGGDVAALQKPLERILGTGITVTELGENLCRKGFIEFLSRSQVQKNKELRDMLRSFSGTVLQKRGCDHHSSVCVLTVASWGVAPIVFVKPHDEAVRMVFVKGISALEHRGMIGAHTPQEIVATAYRLFLIQAENETTHRATKNSAHIAVRQIMQSNLYSGLCLG